MSRVLEEIVKRMIAKRQISYNERYRQYVIEKANLPYGLTAKEYEDEVKKLAKKYRI